MGTTRPPRREATDEERNRLVVASMGLASEVAYRAWLRWPSVRRLGLDDAKQEAYAALIDAVASYDPALAAFSTYAVPIVRRRLAEAAAAMAHAVRLPGWTASPALRARGGRAAREAARAAEAATRCLDDALAPAAPKASDAGGDLFALAVGCLLHACTRAERRVVIARYWLGLSCAEIGDAVGLSRERVRQLEAGALRKIRRHLGLRGVKRRRAKGQRARKKARAASH